jgi:hypothetical protein
MLENLTWAFMGLTAAGAIFAVFYDWSLRVLTEKWLAVTAKNLSTAQKSVQRAWLNGYHQGVKDANYDAGKTTRQP